MTTTQKETIWNMLETKRSLNREGRLTTAEWDLWEELNDNKL
jgi:hypothetical protein